MKRILARRRRLASRRQAVALAPVVSIGPIGGPAMTSRPLALAASCWPRFHRHDTQFFKYAREIGRGLRSVRRGSGATQR